MKTTTQIIVTEFCNNPSLTCNFTEEGLKALYDYLEEVELSMDTEMEFDPIAIRCEFTEYENLEELQVEYDLGFDKAEYDEQEWKDGEWHDDYLSKLEDNTTVIEFDGGYIIADF